MSTDTSLEQESESIGAVQIDGLRKEYDDIVAVNNIDLTVEAGEFLTLLGPSGCGKSTTLRMISGLETPTTGQVSIDGEDVTAQPANRRNTSMVFQEWALFPHMTVGENISFGLEMDGIPKDEREESVTDVLELVELSGYQDRKATELSGGQKQRVAMARALVREPDVLLLDEPLASLDRKLRQHMEVELKRIQNKLGITFIYVTHDQEEALTMSDRIAVMNDGQLEQIGETTELYEQPESKFVATFLGETNLFEGAVRSAESGTVLDISDDLKIKIAESIAGTETNIAYTVRPEEIHLHSPNKTISSPNKWFGTVTEAIFKGSLRQYEIDIGSAEVHIERQSNEETTEFEVGDSVQVSFSANAGELISE
jgi:spermidine/putrescine transport system ATP-binding protein